MGEIKVEQNLNLKSLSPLNTWVRILYRNDRRFLSGTNNLNFNQRVMFCLGPARYVQGVKKFCGAISHDKEWKVVGSKSVIYLGNLVINDVFKRYWGRD